MYSIKDYGFPCIPFPSSLMERAPSYDAFGEGKLSIKDEAEKMYRRIRNKSLTDDELFRLVMYGNTELAEFFSSMYIPRFVKGSIRRVTSDYELPTALTKSSRLDAYAEIGDSECVIDFEMESTKKGDVLKRTRQYVANLTNSFILKGDGYYRIPRTVIVFFIPYDIMGKGRPYYVVRPKDQDGDVVDRDDIRIYVNWKYEGDDEYGRVCHDLKCSKPEEMYYNEIRKRVAKIKDKEEGAKMREDVFYRMRREGIEEGRIEGYREATISNARAMLKSGISSERVADILKLSKSEMKEVMRK